MKRNATVVKTMVSVDFFLVPTIRFQAAARRAGKAAVACGQHQPLFDPLLPRPLRCAGPIRGCSLSCWRRSTCAGAESRSWGATQPDGTGKRRLERQLSDWVCAVVEAKAPDWEAELSETD